MSVVALPLVIAWRPPPPRPALHHAAHQIGTTDVVPSLPRRAALLGAILTPFAPVYSRSLAFDDPITLKLKVAREQLGAGISKIDDKQWDALRKPINALLPSLSLKGYTGESVKSRALAWARVGNVERSEEIIALRGALVVQLSQLDNALFAAQTNKAKKMLSEKEMKDVLQGTLAALDALIAKMGCETRVIGGACEII